MRMRRRAGYAVLAAGLSLLAGCGTSTGPGSSSPVGGAATRTGIAQESPTDLVGLWQLEADGEAPGTVLRIGGDLSVWRPCSESWGGWAADASGHFVAALSSYSYACAGPKPTRPPKPEVPPPPASTWLTRGVRYRVQGADRVLLDAGGRVVARLRPGGRPTPNPNVAAQLSAPPTLDGQLIRRLGPPAPLSSGVTAPTATQLVGTWVRATGTGATSEAAAGPFATFQADGGWRASDGCNPGEGRWVLGADGRLLAVPSTADGKVACGTAGQATPVEADRLGLQGQTLISYDADGKVVGRWIRPTARG